MCQLNLFPYSQWLVRISVNNAQFDGLHFSDLPIDNTAGMEVTTPIVQPDGGYQGNHK